MRCDPTITAEPMVLEVRFERQGLGITGMFPERTMLASQGFTVEGLQHSCVQNTC